MQYTTDFQTHYTDHQRQMAWVNEAGWQFDPPTTRKRGRVAIARALIALATWLFPPVLESGETQAAPRADAGFTRNATIA